MGLRSLEAAGLYGKLLAYSKFGFAALLMLGFFGAFVVPSISAQCETTCSTSATCGTCTTASVATSCTLSGGTTGVYCVASSGSSSTTSTGQINSTICTIYDDVHNAIFILGLALMILGGALYAGAHIMPGTTKGTVQGYGMGLLLGGVIGIIIALISPYILGLLISGNSSIGSAATTC